MQRHELKDLILPLSAFERSKRSSKQVETPAENESVRALWKRDASGFLILTNNGMNEFSRSSKDSIHAPIFNEALNPHLRLMIHHRFNEREFHQTEFLSVNYVYRGKLKVSFPNKSEAIVLNEGSLFLMNSGIIHRLSIDGEDDVILGFQIEKEFLSENLLSGLTSSSTIINFLLKTMTGIKSNFSYIFCDFKDDVRMQNLFEDIFCEYLEPNLLSHEVINSYLKLFFLKLVNNEPKDHNVNSFNLVLKILSYIDENATTVSLHDLSLRFSLSEKYLSRYIKIKTGTSFSDLCLKARMEKAKYLLLQTKLTVDDIASDCGYTNLSFFYRKFKEFYGILPKKMRKINNN